MTRIFGLCLFLASCSLLSPQPAPIVVVQSPAPAPVHAPVAAPAPVPDSVKPIVTVNVAEEYRKAAQKEIPVVIAPDATPQRVRGVHKADATARRALSRLEAQGRHPTKEALDAARTAVKQLFDALSSSTDEVP